MTTTQDENTEQISFEKAVQRVFNWVIEKLPVANNSERDWIKAHVDALFTDPNAEPPTTAEAPVETPVQPVTTPPATPVVTPMGTTQVNDGVTENGTPGFPASYPIGGSSEDIRNWYATATDEEIAQVAQVQ